jgi:hypothetical protein
MFSELEALGRDILRQVAPDAAFDAEVAIYVMTNAFIASIADEPSQDAFLGGSVFTPGKARERLRAELKRIARAVFPIAEARP